MVVTMVVVVVMMGFFSLFHMFTEVQFNAIMTIDNNITRKTQKRLISSASTPHQKKKKKV